MEGACPGGLSEGVIGTMDGCIACGGFEELKIGWFGTGAGTVGAGTEVLGCTGTGAFGVEAGAAGT